MGEILKVESLTKNFKGKKAVSNVSFSIKKGEIAAILGPNGAGKTTTILMILGLLKPDGGNVEIFGKLPGDNTVLQKIGAMMQEVSLMDSLKVKELLELVRSYYHNPLPMDEIANLCGITEEDFNKRTEKLSGGQKRKVNFALALAGNPDLLFFDEPTVGMDVTARRVFWSTVNKLRKEGRTILFSTHYLQEADDYADRILLINQGELVEDGTPDQIKDKLTKQYVAFIPLSEFLVEQFQELDYVSSIIKEDQHVYIYTTNADAVISKIYEEKLSIRDIQIVKGRLEEAFEQLTIRDKDAV